MINEDEQGSTVREQSWSRPPPPTVEQCLVVVSSPDQAAIGRRIVLSTEAMLGVGREVADTRGKIGDDRMSRMHFRVTWDGRSETHRVGDAGSANGTYVNGSPTTSCAVVENDVIRAGQTLLVVDDMPHEGSFEARLQRAARSALPVLLLGETGAGKDVTAQTIHRLSGRRGPFVPVNCGALPRELAASELFGHTKAAFSGAQQARQGLFQSAEGGTLFLDEVGELPLDLQPLLLRALQDGKVRALGANREEELDVRVIAATNQDLHAMIEAGRFREDLYARLAHETLEVPALRERKAEILELCQAFAVSSLRLGCDAAEALLLWDYERNVRELKGIVQRLAERNAGRTIELSDLDRVAPELVEGLATARERATEARPKSAPPSATRPGRAELVRMLKAHNGNVTTAAQELGTSRTQLYRWLKSAGVEWRS